MPLGDVDSWDLTVAAFHKRYPADIIAKSPALAPGSGEAPNAANLGAFLEAMLVYLASIEIVVLDELAESGLAEADTRLHELRRETTQGTMALGVLASVLRGPNPSGEGTDCFDGSEPVATSDAPDAALIASLWHRLSNGNRLADVDLEAEAKMAKMAVRASYPWIDLVRVLIEIRNSQSHNTPMTEITDRFTEGLWRRIHRAAVETGVTGVGRAVLSLFTTGSRSLGYERPDGSFVCQYSTPRPDPVLGARVTGQDGDATLGDVVLRLQQNSFENDFTDNQYQWAVLVGPLRHPLEVLRDSVEVRQVAYREHGEAWLSAGTVAVVSSGGHTRLLMLPLEVTVVVALDAKSASNYSGFQPGVSDEGDELLARRTVRETITLLNNRATSTSAQKRIPRGIAGRLDVHPPDQRYRSLGVDAAIVIATSRAVAKAVLGRLPDDVQVAVSRNVLEQSWHPHRDFFGWVDVTTGQLLGPPFSCPRADLLMLVPTKLERRTRQIDLAAAAHYDEDNEPAPTDFESLARSCMISTKALEAQQPNPLVPLLRPLAAEFQGSAIVVSPFTWAAGLLFQQGEAARVARRCLEGKRLPRHIELYSVSTAATRQEPVQA